MIDMLSAALSLNRSALARFWLLCPAAGALAGCSPHSAPALFLFGAYFPGFLLFAILAILIAMAARIAFGIAGLAPSLPFPLFTCLAIGILVAGVVDLVWLGN